MSSNENNFKNDNQNLIEYNKKNYKMSLLFIQAKELKRLYYSKMENSLKNYFLVDKSWLDEYKLKNNYKSAADMFDSFNDWKNYEDFKEAMGDSFLVDDQYITRLYVKVDYEKGKYKNIIEYPKNIELVCEEYFKDCFKNSVDCPLCEVLIGNKSLIILDPENEEKNKDIVVYICTRIGKEEDFNFLVKVIYIIVFDNLEVMKEELKEMCSSEGVNNYLSKRNLEINNKEQNIINSKNEKIGKFMVVYEEISPSDKNMNFPNYNNILNNNNNNINNFQQSIEEKNQNINNNIEYPKLTGNNVEEDNDEFNLHFKYKKKEIVLYIKSNMKFSEIKTKLLEIYESFRSIKIKGFVYDYQMINDESTCEELNIKSASKIIIIEE